MRKILAALFALILLPLVWADELLLNDDVPQTYVVQKGDTLWDISTMYLKTPWAWVEIWHNNPEISNPHLIYPGDVIGLSVIDGRTQLTIQSRGDGEDTVVYTEDNTELLPDGTVKVKPNVRFESLSSAISVIPRLHIQSFLTGNQILSSREIQDAAHIIAGQDGRLILGSGDKVYARGNWAKDVVSYEVFRPGEIYLDPVTDKFLGYEAIYIGKAVLDSYKSEVATLVLSETSQNVRINDR